MFLICSFCKLSWSSSLCNGRFNSLEITEFFVRPQIALASLRFCCWLSFVKEPLNPFLQQFHDMIKSRGEDNELRMMIFFLKKIGIKDENMLMLRTTFY
jgi:hypothetical protein